METICKKCGYKRKTGDIAPEYECPKCGAIYKKVDAYLNKKAEKLKRHEEILNKNKNSPQIEPNKQTHKKFNSYNVDAYISSASLFFFLLFGFIAEGGFGLSAEGIAAILALGPLSLIAFILLGLLGIVLSIITIVVNRNINVFNIYSLCIPFIIYLDLKSYKYSLISILN